MSSVPGYRDGLTQPGWLVQEIAKAMVDYPDEVQVREVTGSSLTIIELTVHPGDVGKMIGTRGVHADAIRRLVKVAAGKLRHNYRMEIIEDR